MNSNTIKQIIIRNPVITIATRCITLTLLAGGALISVSGCALFRGRSSQVEQPPVAAVQAPLPPERVDLNRTARDIEVPDRTSFTVDDAVAKARLALEKGSTADLRTTAKFLAPFGPDSRPWHAEDQARVARYQILVGLAAIDEGCITSGAANLTAARPNIRNVVYEHEGTLLYAAHARLRRSRPDIAPTRLSAAMALFTSSRSARRFVDDLHLVQLRGGDAAKQSDFEHDVQEVAFDFLGVWIKGEPAKEALQDLLQTAAMGEYRGYRVALPAITSDADVLAVHLLTQTFRDLGADI